MMNWLAMRFSTRLILQALKELEAEKRRLTYEEIAAHAGTSRVTVSRAIPELLDKGMVERSGGPRGYLYSLKEGR